MEGPGEASSRVGGRDLDTILYPSPSPVGGEVARTGPNSAQVLSERSVSPVGTFPTAARRRQKAQAKAGHVPKKKTQVVQQVFDDCGEDFSALYLANDADDITKEFLDPTIITNISHHFGMCGCYFTPECPQDMFLGNPNGNMIFETFSEFSAWDSDQAVPADAQNPVDVAEICGGAADTAYILVRRNFTHGLNFDITVGFSLRAPGAYTESNPQL